MGQDGSPHEIDEMMPVTNLYNTLDLDLGLWCQFECENGVRCCPEPGKGSITSKMVRLVYALRPLEIKRPSGGRNRAIFFVSY